MFVLHNLPLSIVKNKNLDTPAVVEVSLYCVAYRNTQNA